MSPLIIYALLSLDIPHLLVVDATATLRPVILPGGCNDTCPSQEEKDAAQQNIRNVASSMISIYIHEAIGVPTLISECGGDKLWYRVAYLNMSDPSQQCPISWREINVNGTRGCRRPNSSGPSCPATLYSTVLQYGKVCGRVIGYQYGSADAFFNRLNSQQLDSHYVYGVSITHGTPRNHIWTLAAGLTEGEYFLPEVNCPCAHPDNSQNSAVPSFVGDNYYLSLIHI